MFSAAEFNEAITDYNIEPWGDERADWRAATIVQAMREVGIYAMHIAAALGVKVGTLTMPKTSDCVLDFDPKPEVERWKTQSPEAQVAFFKMAFGQKGAK